MTATANTPSTSDNTTTDKVTAEGTNTEATTGQTAPEQTTPGQATTGSTADVNGTSSGDRSLVDEVRKLAVNSGYAAVGLTDIAVSRVAETRNRVVAAGQDLKGRTVAGEVRKVRDAVASVPGNMIASGVSLAEDAEHRVEALTERGRGAAGRVVSAEPASTIIDQATNVVDASREVLAASPLAKVMPESMLKPRQATGDVLEGDVKPAKSLRDAVVDLVQTARKVAIPEGRTLSDITVPVEPVDTTTEVDAETATESVEGTESAETTEAAKAPAKSGATKTATTKTASKKTPTKSAATKSAAAKSTTTATSKSSTAKSGTSKSSKAAGTTAKTSSTKSGSSTQQKLADIDAALETEQTKAEPTKAEPTKTQPTKAGKTAGDSTSA